MSPTLVWLRQDLRLADHPALDAAVRHGGPVIPVFVLDDAAAGGWRPGGAARWWLHHSLAALAAALAGHGGRLVLRRGDTVATLLDLAAAAGAGAIFYNAAPEPYWQPVDAALATAAAAAGIAVRRFPGAVLLEPGSVLSKQGTPIKVFTPFWKACLRAGPPPAPLPAPDSIPAPASAVASDRLEDWALLPTAPDWAGGLRAAWTPGEDGAHDRLRAFLDGAVDRYHEDRNRPARPGTSRLSPHLHAGEITPRQIWHAVDQAGRGAAVFMSEIGWREFSIHLLAANPTLPDRPLRPEFAAFPWAGDTDSARRAWQDGRTGYPIVDAGMRALYTTGWMHNRVRMIAASFLIKDLLIPWQAGEAWFWDTLVDADLASNAASWQWVAGCGADAAPYFRVFNPVLQGEKFDPDGSYVRQWVPELARLPDTWLHKPWDAPAAVLRQAGVRLGRDYPLPIIDHGKARRRALAAFDRIKTGGAPAAANQPALPL